MTTGQSIVMAAVLPASALTLAASAEELQGPQVVVCWGQNSLGQRTVPSDVITATAVAGGSSHSIALKDDGSVRCWGSDDSGQSNVPNDIGVAIAIASSGSHTIALRIDGSVRCWGANDSGQCNVPADLGAASAIAGGGSHTIALRVNGSVRCWGFNLFGQCGVPPQLNVATAIAGGGAHTVAIRNDGELLCWGYNPYGQCSVPGELGPTTAIAGGSLHTVALRADGSVVCWGYNTYGQCDVPTDLGTAIAIAGGSDHTIALRADGTVRCWGDNSRGQCSVPNDLGTVTAIAAGGAHTIAIRVAASANLRSGANFSLLAPGILDAQNGDTLLIAPWAADGEDVDYRGKSVELRSTNAIARGAESTTLFANGARLSAPESIVIDGTTNVPTNAGITISSGESLTFEGNTTISLGGSILAQNDGSPVVVNGSMTLATNAIFNPLAPVSLHGTLDLLGGVVVAESMETAPDSELVAVNGTINVDNLTLGGAATCLNSAIVSDVSVTAGAQLAASGQVVGSLANAGRTITTEDLVVVGSVTNAANSQILAQVGVLYITGDLVNNGQIFGNVITAPGYQGGGSGTGGTQFGDGIRVAGSVSVGPAGELRFVEDLWKFSVCGDLSLACASDDVRFNGAKLSLDGCEGTVQSLEATSADLGCVAAAFSGEETTVSLIGELDIVSGATVTLVDHFNNAPGKSAEAVYARGLTVQPGATLLTNGVKVVTRNALIQGTVDDMSNICVVVDAPDPDVNGDGMVNGIDLAFVLTYWNSSAPIADLNDDGIVGGADLAIVLSGWTG